MGTRCITSIKNKDGQKITEIYRQYDGYPDGHGLDLLKFINSGEKVNGIPNDDKIYFNGIECFAAMLIWKLKDGNSGNIYLYPPSENHLDKGDYWDKYGADYYYEINNKLEVRCWNCIEDKEISLDKIKEKMNDSIK